MSMLNALLREPLTQDMLEIRDAVNRLQALAEHHFDRQRDRDDNLLWCQACADNQNYHLGVAMEIHTAMGPLWVDPPQT